MSRDFVLDRYPAYEATIGIETHVQLITKSKIFCTSPNCVGKEPNSNLCIICAGYPGVLPVLNEHVVNAGILAGLATHSTIAPLSSFDRKHYFYPDLPKGYQITQQYEPICTNGYIAIRLTDGSIKKISLARIHIEEDAGKNIHSDTSNESFVDLNRAGTPLLEIVSNPDISNADEARRYLKALHAIVQYLNICTGNMEEGAFRADINISVRKKGAKEYGTRVELKNINSFKFISDAIEYELERHIQTLEDGGRLTQETRLWDNKNRVSIAMRSKEGLADYRYFQDPDLPLVRIDDALIERTKKQMPELPYDAYDRLVTQKGLSPYEAEILVEDRALTAYFDAATAINPSKQIINWILRDLLGYLKEHSITLADCMVTPEKLATIITLVESGKINNAAAKEIFETVAQSGGDPLSIVKEKGLEQIGSAADLEKIVTAIIQANPGQVADYKSGNKRVFGFFIGEAMKQTQGKGDPKMLRDLFVKQLES